MPEIDNYVLVRFDKVLSILFIVLIFTANGRLLLKIVRTPKYFTSPKFTVLISLAIGDLLNGIYSLLVETLFLFEKVDLNNNCVVWMTSKIYHDFVLSLIYGVGVMLLAFEVVARHLRRNTTPPKRQGLLSFSLSIIPWLIGLAIVVPLMTEEIDWVKCNYQFPNSITFRLYYLCNIVPPVGAIIFCCVVKCMKLTPTPISLDPAAATRGGYDRRIGNAIPMRNLPPQQPFSEQRFPPTTGYPNHGFFQTRVPPTTGYPNYGISQQHFPPTKGYPNHGISQQRFPPTTGYLNNDFPQKRFPPTRAIDHNFYYERPPNSHPHIPTPDYHIYLPQVPTLPPPRRLTSNNEPPPINPVLELTILFRVAIAHFICVAPYGMYYISRATTDHFAGVVIENTLFWLFNLRSIVTPCMWL
jgi:hypothetical protein